MIKKDGICLLRDVTERTYRSAAAVATSQRSWYYMFQWRGHGVQIVGADSSDEKDCILAQTELNHSLQLRSN